MRLVVVLLSVLAALSVTAYADPASDDALLQVKVAESFVEVHTGPGRGYPVFHVVERDASLTLLFQRAGWIKVETLRGRVGWVPRRALTATLDGAGQPPVMTRLGHEAFLSGHWQASVMMGELEGASSLSVALGYRFTENLTAEGMFSRSSGDFASTTLAGLNLQHQMFSRWRVSPYVLLGAGKASIEPRETLVRPENRDENYAVSGLGIKAYLSRGFVLRSEYRSYVLFTEENDNRNLEEWKIGFSALF